ncbi:MAG: metallophosphoesterase, partial [Candidatus Odinarchaeota archaeon]
VSEIDEKGKSIIINPNLGRPSILSIDRKLKNKEFETILLFISDIADADIFGKIIDKNVSLIPLFDYKWSYKLIFKKEKKGLFSKWREKRFRKKRKKFLEDKIKFVDEHDLSYEGVKTLKSRLHRGEPIKTTIIKVENSSISHIHDISSLNGLNPQDFLIKNQVFGDMKNFYNVNIKFTLNKKVLNFLKERNFIMFDLYGPNERINYHSIVVSKQKWEDFTFVHATDLHLAERNDRIYGIIKKWAKSSVKSGAEDFFKTITKKLKLGKKKKDEKEEILSDIKVPLRKRLINPNNQFRQFIKLMNRKVLKNELDFIVMTGDLVDFTILSRLAKQVRKLKDTFLFKYEDSNWQVFKNCVLNLPTNHDYKGIIRGEELNCPIFTTLGNHDYRPFHYDLTWAEMYKKIGLNASEAIALNEMFSASPITALTKTSSAVKGYLSDINSFYDFFIKLGNNLFIVLNSGADSFKNIRDLITGHPSVTGISTRQVKYLENLINNVFQKGMNTFLFLHGPPLNTGGKSLKINLFKKEGKRIVKKKLSEFKESLFRQLEKPISSARIDGIFNMKHGCVSSNWEKLVKFCKDCCILTLAGHTHDSLEFRLEDTEDKSSVYDAPPFKLKKIENPAAIYYDEYSEIYTNAKDIQNNGPFVVQTPALGLGRYGHPETAGGYREVIIKDGKLSSFKLHYLKR